MDRNDLYYFLHTEKINGHIIRPIEYCSEGRFEIFKFEIKNADPKKIAAHIINASTDDTGKLDELKKYTKEMETGRFKATVEMDFCISHTIKKKRAKADIYLKLALSGALFDVNTMACLETTGNFDVDAPETFATIIINTFDKWLNDNNMNYNISETLGTDYNGNIIV